MTAVTWPHVASTKKGLLSHLRRSMLPRKRMNLGSLIHELWIASIALEAGLVGIVLFRRIWRKFPFFTAYAIVTFLDTATTYLIRKQPVAYFYSYWIWEGIGILLGFAVVFEVFRHIFETQNALSRLAVLVFKTASVLLVCLAIVVILMQTPIAKGLANGVSVAEEAARVIEVGLLMCLFLFSTAVGLHWKQSVFGIAIGLGLFTAVELISVTMQAEFGRSAYETLAIARILAFNTSLVIWICYMLAPERVTIGEVPKTAQLEQWNQAIMELIHQ